MSSRRLDAKFTESASLLAQIFSEARKSTRRCQNSARDAVWRDIAAFLDAAAKEHRVLTLFDFESFLEHMAAQSEEMAERLKAPEADQFIERGL